MQRGRAPCMQSSSGWLKGERLVYNNEQGYIVRAKRVRLVHAQKRYIGLVHDERREGGHWR